MPIRSQMGRWFLAALLCSLFLAGCKSAHRHDGNPVAGAVQLVKTNDGVLVSIGGQFFTKYIATGLSRPALYPLLGPGQVPMTRHWPFEPNASGEEHDHPHHLSVWFEHEINGHDFWAELPASGKTVHAGYLQVAARGARGVITTTNYWQAANGTVIAGDIRRITFYDIGPKARLLDYEVTLFASHGDLVFKDTKEGTMAVRIAESMRLTHGKKPGEGHIVLSSGQRDAETWGKRAEWCDYYGPNSGQTLGIAIFDHPKNLRHPTWWHVRDYGLLAANPFGIHDFEKKPNGTGDYTLRKGDKLTFRYRIYVHEADEIQGQVNERYREYVEGKTQAQWPVLIPGRK